MRIALSPDENPGDPGSASADGIAERTVNLRVGVALQAVLQGYGQDVWFDPSLTFEARVAQANGDGTELLIAIAHNSSTPGLSGTQFVFCPDGGQAFGRQAAAADAVYAQLARIPGWPGRLGDAVEPIYECCEFGGDTVYVELLFMSPEDQRIWSRPSYPAEAAEAVARGLASVYGFAPATPPAPASPQEEDAVGAIGYIETGGQQHEFEVVAAGVEHRWQPPSPWAKEVLPGSAAAGLAPGSDILVKVYGQIQVWVDRPDHASAYHAWYDGAWHSEILA